MNMKLENKKFLRITELYAFVAIAEDGEGLMGGMAPNGQWFPFIGADLERVEQLKSIADKVGVPYEIRYFKSV